MKVVTEVVEEETDIFTFRERVLSRWKEHDPFLEDPEGFKKLFDQEYHKRFVEKEKQEKKDLDKAINNLATELLRPVVVFPSGWAEDSPKWLRERIQLDRLANLMKGTTPGEATDSEALYYMYPRSLEAPMDHDWCEIYLYLGMKVMGPDKFKDSGIFVSELTDWQQMLLKDLKRWIYEKSVKGLKERERRERRSSEERDRRDPETP